MFNFKNIFFKEKTPKKYLSCHWAEHGISFYVDIIKTCCMAFHSGGGIIPTMKLQGESFDYKTFFKKKSNHRKLHRNGTIHPKCVDCPNLEEKAWDDKNYIDHIDFGTWTRCNADCTYCFTAPHKDYFNTKPAYKILKDVKKLLDKKILVPGGEVMFGGGEPTINEEFEEILELLLDNNFDYFKIHSSGIEHSLAVERCIKEGKADLIISPDAGENELYKKIKQVDCFDAVWGNIKKYAAAQTDNNKHQVKAKYIIIPEINDSKQNIDDFFEKVIASSVNAVRLDLEFHWYSKNKTDQQKIASCFELLKYAEQKASEIQNFQFFFHAQAQAAINENQSLYQDIAVV